MSANGGFANTPSHRASGWTEERVELLKELHKAGLSGSEIAKRLGGVSRNAVIGKCVRLGLGQIGGGKASAPDKARAQHRRGEAVPLRNFSPRPKQPKGVFVLAEMKGGSGLEKAVAAQSANAAARANPPEHVRRADRAFAPLVGRVPVPFGSPGCKWPVDGEGASMLCCGAARDLGRPYCSEHWAAAHAPFSPRRSQDRKPARPPASQVRRMSCEDCESLRDQIAYLKSELGLLHDAAQLATLISAFSLTPGEARILLTLYMAHGHMASRWTLLEAMPRQSRRETEDERSLGLVAVMVSRLRRHIGRDAIQNVWGLGVRLPQATVERVRAVLEAAA